MSDRVEPNLPIDIIFRPLTGGMVSDAEEASIPNETLLHIEGCDVTPRGLKRRNGWEIFAGGTQTDAESGNLIDVVSAWKTDGTKYATLLTEKSLYQVGTATLTRVDSTFSTGGMSMAGSTMYLSSVVWSAGTNVVAGDLVELSGLEVFEIITNNVSNAVLAAVPSMTYAGSAAYIVRRSFDPDDDLSLDFAGGVDNTLLITDHSRVPFVYDGTTLSNFFSTGSYKFGTIEFFKDRVWGGNTIESGLYYRSRIRWSGVNQYATFDSADYLDLPYTPGQIIRLKALGNLIIAYFDDSIWYGVPTNLTDLPYAFTRIETRYNVGLCGPHAVTPGDGGHYFVGRDNIYFLPSDPRQGPQPVGSQIVSETVKKCTDFNHVYAVPDVENQRIVFGFPKVGTTITEVWALNTITRGWSFEETGADMVANPGIALNLTWNDLSGSWSMLGQTYPTWGQMTGVTASRRLFRGENLRFYELGDGNAADDAVPIPVQLITKDIDLGLPDLDKSFLRMGVMFRDPPSATTSFCVYGSEDGGESWVSHGTLDIDAGARKGYLDFTQTAAMARFKLVTSSAAITPWVMAGITMRVVPLESEYEGD